MTLGRSAGRNPSPLPSMTRPVAVPPLKTVVDSSGGAGAGLTGSGCFGSSGFFSGIEGTGAGGTDFFGSAGFRGEEGGISGLDGCGVEGAGIWGGCEMSGLPKFSGTIASMSAPFMGMDTSTSTDPSDIYCVLTMRAPLTMPSTRVLITSLFTMKFSTTDLGIDANAFHDFKKIPDCNDECGSLCHGARLGGIYRM